MANFHYFHPADNVAPDATVTTGGTEDTDYPLENATDLSFKNLQNPSKLTGSSGDWIFDFGSAQRVDAVVIWHNFDTGLAYSVQMNASNSWGTPTVDLSATAPTKRQDDSTIKAYHDLRSVSGYSTGGFRYLRINVTGTNSDPIGLKILIFSTVRQTGRNMRWGWGRSLTQTAIRMTTDARVQWNYDLTASGRIIKVNIPGKDADYALIDAWIRACRGSVKPTVIVPDPSVNDAWLGLLSAGQVGVISPGIEVMQIDAPYQFTNVNPIELTLEEITAGDPEWE